MDDIYRRSALTNQIFEYLASKNHITFIVDVPALGSIRLRGDALLEFLWVLRSNRAERLMEKWLERKKEAIKDLTPAYQQQRATEGGEKQACT